MSLPPGSVNLIQTMVLRVMPRQNGALGPGASCDAANEAASLAASDLAASFPTPARPLEMIDTAPCANKRGASIRSLASAQTTEALPNTSRAARAAVALRGIVVLLGLQRFHPRRPHQVAPYSDEQFELPAPQR